MIYQIRSMSGKKLLERENPDEVRYWLGNRPELRDSQVWIMEEYPGNLQDVLKASEFMKSGRLNRSYGTTNDTKISNNNIFK